MQSLEVMIREGRKFDYVFGDLTDVPVTPTPQNEIWDFIKLIINTSIKILKPEGKYMTHVRNFELFVIYLKWQFYFSILLNNTVIFKGRNVQSV